MTFAATAFATPVETSESLRAVDRMFTSVGVFAHVFARAVVFVVVQPVVVVVGLVVGLVELLIGLGLVVPHPSGPPN